MARRMEPISVADAAGLPTTPATNPAPADPAPVPETPVDIGEVIAVHLTVEEMVQMSGTAWNLRVRCAETGETFWLPADRILTAGKE